MSNYYVRKSVSRNEDQQHVFRTVSVCAGLYTRAKQFRKRISIQTMFHRVWEIATLGLKFVRSLLKFPTAV